MMSLFIITYVWQNIEIMKMKMEYRKFISAEREISERNDRIRYNLEGLRNFSQMKNFAEKNGLKQIAPDDVVIINLEGNSGNKDEN
jgi:hypothetical protein